MTRRLLAGVRDRSYRAPSSRWMIRLLPYRVAHIVAWCVGLGVYFADRHGRAETIANLRAAFADQHSQKEIRRLARLTYCHFLVPFVDLLFLIHAGPGRLRRFVTRRFVVENQEALEQACEEGRGAIVCVPHAGAFLLGGAALAFRLAGRTSIHILSDRPDRPQHPSQAYVALAEQLNIHLVYNDGLAIRSALRALRAGGILVILPDMFQISEGLMFVPLFGLLSATMGGAAFLALRTGAPIFFVRALPERLRFRVVVEPPLIAPRSGEVSKQIYALSLLISRRMEGMIRRRPELWGYWINLDRRAFWRQPVPDRLTWEGCRALVSGLRNGFPVSSGDTRAFADLVLSAMEIAVADGSAPGGLGAALESFTESCRRMVPLGGAPRREFDLVQERR